MRGLTMSTRQLRALLIAALCPIAIAILVTLAIPVMAAFLVPVDAAGILRLWPITLGLAVPLYFVWIWWLVGNWSKGD